MMRTALVTAARSLAVAAALAAGCGDETVGDDMSGEEDLRRPGVDLRRDLAINPEMLFFAPDFATPRKIFE